MTYFSELFFYRSYSSFFSSHLYSAHPHIFLFQYRVETWLWVFFGYMLPGAPQKPATPTQPTERNLFRCDAFWKTKKRKRKQTITHIQTGKHSTRGMPAESLNDNRLKPRTICKGCLNCRCNGNAKESMWQANLLRQTTDLQIPIISRRHREV